MQGNVSFGSLSIMDGSQVNSSLNIVLVSRRSVYRAGMRYLRRGIDCESNVANFVETELILNIFDHHLSFVQVRGSVPVFWSQKGFKYRPPLSIDKNIEESLPYFTTHMQDLLHRYGPPLVAVSLVDQTGRELQLAAMGDLVLFSVCFSAIPLSVKSVFFLEVFYSDLIVNMENLLERIGYCWVDKTGEIVKTQRGVIRTNCVDCLDRTNLVQGAISQWVCMRQAQRLGLFGPLCDPPEALVTLLQNMWADNGDAISTQYAGTAALKGDVTRSGERCLAGIVRDGYNSASRYYLSHMRDSSRQKAINALLGLYDVNEKIVEKEYENICRLAAETINFLLPVGEIVVGAWALCNLEQDAETIYTISILTRLPVYDDDFEKLTAVSILPLDDISSIEVGKSGRSSCVYLRVTCNDNSWTWRAGRTRLFNNVAIRLKTLDEANEYTESIAEQMHISPSDGCLATQSKLSTMSPPGGFIGRIRRLKSPFTRSSYPSTVTLGPFENLNELLAASRTNFVLL
uniref:SAC domain-containing protein n=1 Tax=Angiostrongylus cantonensis TaxID=6313 RepID=A0A0K0CZU2_ANGCA